MISGNTNQLWCWKKLSTFPTFQLLAFIPPLPFPCVSRDVFCGHLEIRLCCNKGKTKTKKVGRSFMKKHPSAGRASNRADHSGSAVPVRHQPQGWCSPHWCRCGTGKGIKIDLGGTLKEGPLQLGVGLQIYFWCPAACSTGRECLHR